MIWHNYKTKNTPYFLSGSFSVLVFNDQCIMSFLVCLHKIIKSCESPSLESYSLEVPLTFFHNALCPVVLCKVLKRLNFFNFSAVILRNIIMQNCSY